jgi:O-antigen/teichoic acid export membrane protein
MNGMLLKLQSKFSNGHWPGFLAGMTSSIINLFLPMILVRILTPEQIGIYKIFFLYIHSFTFLSLAGAPLYSIFYFIGKKDGRNYIDHAWKLSIVLSVIALIVGLIFSPLISEKTNLTSHQTLFLLITGALITPSSFYGEYLLASGKTALGPIFHSIFEIVKSAAIIIVAYVSRDINTTFYVFGASFLIKLLLSLALGIRQHILTLKFDKQKMSEIVTYCAPMSSAGLLGFFLEKIDMLTLSAYLSPKDFAFYSMGCLVIPPLMILEMSVTKVLMPKLSTLWHEKKISEMGDSFKQAQADIAFLMIPAVFGLYIFSSPIIKILFTDQYIESVPYLKIFAFSYLAYIIPHDTIARSSGNTKWILKVYLTVTPISLISVVYAAKNYGAVEALLITVFFRFIPKIWGLIYSSQLTQMNIISLLPLGRWLYNIVINLSLTLAVLNVKQYFPDETSWFMITGPIYAICFFIIDFAHKRIKRGRW